MGMKLEPKETDKNKNYDDFEFLICQLLEAGLNISINQDDGNVTVYLPNESYSCLVFGRDGKYKFE